MVENIRYMDMRVIVMMRRARGCSYLLKRDQCAMKAVKASSQQLCGATVWALWNKLWLVMLRYMDKDAGRGERMYVYARENDFRVLGCDKLATKRKAQDASNNNKRGALTTT